MKCKKNYKVIHSKDRETVEIVVKHCIEEQSKIFVEQVQSSSGWTVLTIAVYCVREIRYQGI